MRLEENDMLMFLLMCSSVCFTW